ncbi:MAG: flagellar motor protein MotB [Hyphomicrobium sp.]
MSDGDKDISAQQPIIIVRRRRAEEEGHHGGAWKIAYADFMTAMMAFFLVMWLVNAADKKTIVQVAAYFNPMRLTERSSSIEGLEDQEEKSPDSKKPKKTWADKMKEDDKDKKEERSDKSATSESDKMAAHENNKAGAVAVPVASQPAAKAKTEAAMLADPAQALAEIAAFEKPRRVRIKPPARDGLIKDPFDPAAGVVEKAEASKKPTKPAHKKADAEEAKKATAEKANTENAVASNQAADAEFLAGIKEAALEAGPKAPAIEAKSTSEGLLISLIDTADSGMFEIGSAKPRPETLAVLQRIGELLKEKSGKIVIRGHTDGRAYKAGDYDNWRLSSARAQMAFYMLLRGGLGEERFIGIEGRADRELKDLNDTGSAKNRRLEILLKDAAK